MHSRTEGAPWPELKAGSATGLRKAPLLSVFGTAFSLLLAGCSMHSTLKKTPETGKFSGEPMLISIAPNTFLFCQPTMEERRRGKKPYSFTTHPVDDPSLARQAGRGRFRHANVEIVPEAMITTGASVPRVLWGFGGLGAWYHPGAGLMHDWLYESHHRLELARQGHVTAQLRKDKKAEAVEEARIAVYAKLEKFDQDDAADVYAEAMKVLMRANDSLLEIIDRPETKGGKDLALLRGEVKQGRSRPFILWAYHWAVSTDGPFGVSKRIYRTHSTDMETFKVIDQMARTAPEQAGRFISKETAARVRKIREDEEKRIAEYSTVTAIYQQLAAAHREPKKAMEAKKTALVKTQQALKVATGAERVDGLIKAVDIIKQQIQTQGQQGDAFLQAERKTDALIQKASQ